MAIRMEKAMKEAGFRPIIPASQCHLRRLRPVLYGTVRSAGSAGTGNEKAGYYMGIDHRINAVTMAAALLWAGAARRLQLWIV